MDMLTTDISSLGYKAVKEKVDNSLNGNLKKERGYQKKLVNNHKPDNGSSGFTDALLLSLIVAFICGLGVGIGYMLFKLHVGG